jgi:hypothetical protein
MTDFFERLLNNDSIKLSTRYCVVVSLEISKLEKDNTYSIDCIHNNNNDFSLPSVLFQISSLQNQTKNILSPDELKDLLYFELDKIRKCSRCGKVYQNENTEYDGLCNCSVCDLELDYIQTRKDKGKSSSFQCGLCCHTYWNWFGKKSSCCKGERTCLLCVEKVVDHGFCPYCRTPVDVGDFV